MTYQYSGGLLSNASVRTNGLSKTSIGGGDGTPSGTLPNYWLLSQSGGLLFHAGIYMNNTALSLGQIEKVEGFMAWHMFGDGSLLDVSHTYKNSSPY